MQNKIVPISNEVPELEAVYDRISQRIVEVLGEMGADIDTKDPAILRKSLHDNHIHWESRMYPMTPTKSGIYFMKNNISYRFIHIPFMEGLDMTDFMGDRL